MDEVPAPMVPVRMVDILKILIAPCDYFIRISASKHILVVHKGDSVNDTVLAGLMARGLTEVFLMAEDYEGDVRRILESLVQPPKGPRSTATEALAQQYDNTFAILESCGIDAVFTQTARDLSQSTLDFVNSHGKLSILLENFRELPDQTQKHGLLSSSLCVLLGMASGWLNKGVLEKLSLGGLVHDAGKAYLPKELLQKSVRLMTLEELKIYQSHPEAAVQKLTNAGNIHSDVIQMVFEHHELADGSGYPRKLKDIRTSPLGRILIVANAVSEELGSGLRPISKIVEELLQSRPHHFNKTVLVNLSRIIEEDHLPKKRAG